MIDEFFWGDTKNFFRLVWRKSTICFHNREVVANICLFSKFSCRRRLHNRSLVTLDLVSLQQTKDFTVDHEEKQGAS
jgi:hypothetical protein